jgi:hypothetical protein
MWSSLAGEHQLSTELKVEIRSSFLIAFDHIIRIKQVSKGTTHGGFCRLTSPMICGAACTIYRPQLSAENLQPGESAAFGEKAEKMGLSIQNTENKSNRRERECQYIKPSKISTVGTLLKTDHQGKMQQCGEKTSSGQSCQKRHPAKSI